MLLRVILIGMLGIGAAQAQDAPATDAEVTGLAQTLPAATLKKLRGAPDTYLANAASLIYGFGAGGGIDAAGIDGFIAAERARIRARDMMQYLAADVNNDGDISRDEVAVLAAAAQAGKRGRLQRGFDQADSDTNGLLSMAELRGFAQGTALAQMSAADADALKALLQFDADGNGTVAMEEVATGVSALVGLLLNTESARLR